ncbi:MAG: glycosyltransferase family 2 protein, partial [Bacteroidota bacterium]|nr:glycosyltransferase family 2 protein [Bacteroidota bacterium]
DSLSRCLRSSCGTEVIIVVNAPPGADEESRLNNKLTINNIEKWKNDHPECFFRLYTVDVTSCPVEGWGVGLARKTGMDEALRRFDYISRPDGVILSLDADCTVAKNYFVAVQKELLDRNDRSGCSIYFEHPVSGSEYTVDVYRSIIQYELHLRYYYQGLVWTGFPYVHHTVGSAIAVKALNYMKVGGMNRKMAGEDFYFIQKLVPSGGYFNLNTTVIRPSPRLSFRVPFGTGPAMSKITGGSGNSFLSYNIEAFRVLKNLFGMVDKLYQCPPDDTGFLYEDLPSAIKQFVQKDEWIIRLREIKGNTTGPASFRKRFFGWFNMFRIVKYMNFVHSSLFDKIPVSDSAYDLLRIMKMEFSSKDPAELLTFYRKLEKEN